MDTTYILEFWNHRINKYQQCWSGDNIDMANTMYDKPYNVSHTRRLIKVTKEVLFKNKANEYKK